MWPTCGHSGYITPAVFEVPSSGWEHMWAKWMHNPCWLGGSVIGKEFENVALMWGKSLHSPYFFGGPRIGDKMKVWAKWPLVSWRLPHR